MQAVRKASRREPSRRRTVALTVALALNCLVPAFAGPEMLDVDTRFRAKIAKERIRTAAEQRRIEAQEKALAEEQQQSSACGSQSIGNVDTGDRGAAAAPREEFVFAPNAINIVTRGGCR